MCFLASPLSQRRMEEESVWRRAVGGALLRACGEFSNAFMTRWNRTTMFGNDKLHDAVYNRPSGTGLITVSNHVSALDDPFTLTPLLTRSVLKEPHRVRWTMCAANRCFTNPLFSSLSTALKVLPIERGKGLYQYGMDLALSKIDQGDWFHMYPEGTRSKTLEIMPMKPGVGRLVVDAKTPPLVLPIVHRGMDRVIPRGERRLETGHDVYVIVGDPVVVQDILDRSDVSSRAKYDLVATRIGEALAQLNTELDHRIQDCT